MEERKFSFSGVIQKITEYLKNRKALIRLQIVERVSSIVAALVTDGLMIFLGLFALLFLSVSLGIYLGDVLDSFSLGFLLVAGIYLILILIIALAKKGIENSLINLSIRKFLKRWNEEDED